MSTSKKILVIDDEPQIRRFLNVALSAHHFEVVLASTAEEGIQQATSQLPQLIILDLGLPDSDGKAVLSAIREWSQVPVVILSVRDNEKSIVDLLNAGADDYVTKPFNLDELIARMNVALRHTKTEAPETNQLKFDNLTIDLAEKQVFVKDKLIKLTRKEFALLALLAKNNKRVLTQQQILETLWGKEYESELQYLRVYVGQLRQKVEENPNDPTFILTEFGIGYRFNGEPLES